MNPVPVRDLAAVRAAGLLEWFAPASAAVHALGWASALDAREPLFIARAPARLDVIGGIADYSGARVLELPLRESTTALVQRRGDATVAVTSVRGAREHRVVVPLESLVDPATVRTVTPSDGRWAWYVLGVVLACRQRAPRHEGGLEIRIVSDVPEGKGVSSSAALEVAVLAAVAAAWNVSLDGLTLAHAAQWAENHVALAPCGIMDQVTSACGEAGRLLSLTCQPATLGDSVAIPPGWQFVGIDSGIRHAVGGSDYGAVRTAAFMGYRILADRLGFAVRPQGEGSVAVEDARFHGYLANCTPDEFRDVVEGHLPEAMRGDAFLAPYSGITDRVTRVDPSRTYPVRVATRHPVLEHARVSRVAALLGRGTLDDAGARAVGALMRGAHDSYSACGLGSDGTDRLVALVEDLGPARGLYGAKITGGGSGGTVAVLARADATDAVHEVAARYTSETGRPAAVFEGSSPGAAVTGVLRLPAPFALDLP